MALLTVPAYLDGVPGSGPFRSARDDRNVLYGLLGGGRDGTVTTHLTPIVRASGRNVIVAPFDLYVNVNSTRQLRGGTYHVVNDADVTQVVDPAPPSGQKRLDWLGVQILDRQYGDSTDAVKLLYLPGTPSATPVAPDPLALGTPGTTWRLATLEVDAGTSFTRVTNQERPAEGILPSSFYGLDLTEWSLGPGKSVTLVCSTPFHLFKPAYIAGTVSVRVERQPRYVSLDGRFNLDDRDFLDNGDVNVTEADVKDMSGVDAFKRERKDYLTVPVRSRGVISAGTHRLHFAASVSAGSAVGAVISRLSYDLRAVQPGWDGK